MKWTFDVRTLQDINIIRYNKLNLTSFQKIAKETVENFQGKQEAIPVVLPFAPVSRHTKSNWISTEQEVKKFIGMSIIVIF